MSKSTFHVYVAYENEGAYTCKEYPVLKTTPCKHCGDECCPLIWQKGYQTSIRVCKVREMYNVIGVNVTIEPMTPEDFESWKQKQHNKFIQKKQLLEVGS